MDGVVKPRRLKAIKRRPRSQTSKLGAFRDAHFLLVGSILPLFCVLDLTVEYSRHVQTHLFLQTVSDASVTESARTLARGGSTPDAEASAFRVFGAMTPQDRGHAVCSIRAIRISNLERLATLESICTLRPRLGARLLGGATGPILVSSEAVFYEARTAQETADPFPQIRLVK